MELHVAPEGTGLQHDVHIRQDVGFDEPPDVLTGDVLLRARHQFREAAVAIEDGAVLGDRQRAFAHLLHHETVRLVRGAQREDLIAAGRSHDQRLDVAVTNRVDRALSFFELPPEPPKRARGSRRFLSVAMRSLGPALGANRVRRGPLLVRHVSDEVAKRRGKALDERRRRNNLIAAGSFRF